MTSASNIIIRLQNLPNEARAIDIRRFFNGLNIPDGGVHVVGGEKGDAFINFNSDDDARQAMMKTGNIYGNPIRLSLSSRQEMQTIIAQVRAASSNKPIGTPSATPKPAMDQSYPSNLIEQQEATASGGAKLIGPPSIQTLLSDFQSKVTQSPTTLDPTNALLMAATQNGTSPLILQQLLSAINDKQTSLGQTQMTNPQSQFPFQLPLLNNPLQQYNSLNPQLLNLFQQQRAASLANALAFQTHPSASSLANHPFENNHNRLVTSSPFNTTPITADEPYIRVRNVPIGCSYHKIKLLFADYNLNLSDIKIINDQNGQRTGEIVLRLHTNKDVADLLSKDGRLACFNSVLDIKKIDEYTFASAIDSFVPAHAKKAPGATVKNCIRVTGLPKKFERKDVKRFFSGCNVTNRPGGIFIEADTTNGPTFVEFETELDAEKAYFYNGTQIESSTIEMYRITKAEMENEINSLKRGPPDRSARRPPLLNDPLGTGRNSNSPQLSSQYPRYPDSSQSTYSTSMSYSPNNSDQQMICLRLKNIPYSTTEQQIHEYFSNNQTPIENCKICRDRYNRGAGEALVKFSDPQTCQLAYQTKNRQIFYGRSLDLRQISFYEYQNASLTPMLPSNDLQSSSTMNQHFSGGNMKRTSFYDQDQNGKKRARWEGGNNNKDNYGYNRSNPRMNKDDFNSDGKSLDDGQTSMDRRSSGSSVSSSNNMPPLPPELNEFTGRILVISNIAYRATREEILDFLRDYSPISDTLKIRCDANGKPTGFGVVACETADDASRAVTELNNQPFMDRKIHIHQR